MYDVNIIWSMCTYPSLYVCSIMDLPPASPSLDLIDE